MIFFCTKDVEVAWPHSVLWEQAFPPPTNDVNMRCDPGSGRGQGGMLGSSLAHQGVAQSHGTLLAPGARGPLAIAVHCHESPLLQHEETLCSRCADNPHLPSQCAGT